MKFDRRRVVTALGAAALTPFARANEAAWPQKPIRLVLPFAAGGPTDVVARAMALRMSQELGQQIVVDNRVGASGNIACEIVARATPDGYTALYHSSGFTISPALYKTTPYDPLRDFTPVTRVAVIPAVLMVNGALPIHDIDQFIAYVKANAAKTSYGSGGVGNITHLVVALLLQAKGLQAIHVPYKGTAPAMTDLIGGRIDFLLDAVSTGLPYIRDKRVRAIVLTSEKRLDILPDVPTLNEKTMPGFVAPTWHGILLPASAPRPLAARMRHAAVAALKDGALRKQFAPQGVELDATTPDEFASYLKAETVRWAGAVRAAAIEPE